MTGLTLRIDPAIASEGRTITWRGSSTAKSELTSIAYNANGRFTVGADGIACIGPRFSRAETEPVFAEELLLWEFGAARREEFAPDPEDSGKLAALRERLENPATQRVEIVRKTALEALDEISRLYGVEFCYPGFRTGEKPLWDEEASFVSEAATLKEALKGVLSPLACEYRVRPSGLLLLNSQQAKNEDRMTALDEAEVKGHDAAISKLRDTRVNLDGSPLAAEDIIEECARQAGIPFHLDPRLLTSPARWKAVAADLPLGQVLDEVASGTGGEWELRNAKWPKSGNYKSDGCALWFMATRWSTPEPEEK